MRVLTSSHFDRQVLRCRIPGFRAIWRATLSFATAVAATLLLMSVAAAQSQKPKVPGLDKIISANEHLAYTGTVKSVDEKHNVLSVNSVEGGATEIFPIKHSTHVVTADGFRKNLDALTPGIHIIVYYEQRADRRTVSRIELLASETKKKEPHS